MAKRVKPITPTLRVGPQIDAVRSQMADTLANLVSGMGTAKDKATHTMFANSILDMGQLELAYRGDWVARKVVDIPAADATREWRDWQADAKEITAIETEEKRLDYQRKLRSVLMKSRLYGGACLVIGTKQGQPNEELVVERIKQGDLVFIHALSRNEITAGPTEFNLMSKYYGQPQYYQLSTSTVAPTTGNVKRTELVAAKFTEGMQIHPSRVIRFVGREYPDLSSAPDNWGDSILQSVQDAIQQVGTVAQTFAQLVAEAKIDVVKIPELSDRLSNANYSARLQSRFALAAVAKSAYGMLLLDKDEEWERVNVEMTGMSDMLKAYLLIASGAADIPATRMLGQSPAGLSATGDGDLRNYYDAVGVIQKTDITPTINPLDDILIRSTFGSVPSGIFYNWTPLWQLSEKEMAEIAKSKADTWQIDVNAGLINSEVLREARVNQLIEDGLYPGLEGIIEEYGVEEEEPEVVAPPAMIPDPNDPTKTIPNPAAAVAPPPPANTNTPPKQTSEAKAVSDMLERVRLADFGPRPLYVYRKVLNAADLITWAKANGFATTLPTADMHVTIAYSKTPVDWTKIRSSWDEDRNGNITIRPGGMRIVSKFGDNATVLMFTSSELSWRHREMLEYGCSYDYDDYQPHITISYGDTRDEDVLNALKGYQGEIELGPEVWETIDGNFDPNSLIEK